MKTWLINSLSVLVALGFILYIALQPYKRYKIIQTTITLEGIRTAMQIYAYHRGQYPSVTKPTPISECLDEETKKKIISDWKMPDIEYEDAWGNAVLYLAGADGKSFVIASPGKDGQFQVELKPYLNDYSQTELFENSVADLVINERCDRRWPRGISFRSCK